MIYFLKYKLIYLMISVVFLGIGVYHLATVGLDYSIDFTGGSNVTYKVDGQMNTDNVKKVFEEKKVKVLTIDVVENSTYVVKTVPMDEKKELEVRGALGEASGVKSVEQLRFDSVGPSLGKEMIKKTGIAAIVAIIGILLYVTFTFKKFSYGFAAIIAMLHDFLMLIGMYSLLGKYTTAEVDTLFVTALLTTLSFSVHDTIVVFDKIKEYKKTSGLTLELITNRALTETMVRSVNNSLTIILMLVPLVLLGTDSIRFFAAALLIGTVSGTYSSPFVAAPLLVMFDKKKL